MMKRPFFGLLFAVYPVLYIMAANPGQAEPVAVGVSFLLALVSAAALYVLLRRAYGDWARAALGTTGVVVLFFAYGPFHHAIESLHFSGVNVGIRGLIRRLIDSDHLPLSVACVLIAFAGLRMLRKVRAGKLPGLTRALNAMSLVLIALVSIQTAASLLTQNHAGPATADAKRGTQTSTLGYNPDIYYIILDGYARTDVLKDYYGYDNSAFIEGLEQKGFRVATESHPNYGWTRLSLCSSLNFDYVQSFLGDALRGISRDRTPIYEAVRNNAAGRFLQDRGYRFVHFQSTWGATYENPYADEEISCDQGALDNEFYRVMIEASWLKAFDSRAKTHLANCHLRNFETLGEMGGKPGPKFVFAHFVPPHHPYLFDRDGNILRRTTLSNQMDFQARLWEKKDLYVEQLIFVSRKINEAVDRIIATSEKPPIIIIQSDHGPGTRRGLSLAEFRHTRYANLAATLLPGAPPDLMPNNGTPVNQFRRLFNHYFQAGFEILPDRHYESGMDYNKFREFQPSDAKRARLARSTAGKR